MICDIISTTTLDCCGNVKEINTLMLYRSVVE